MRYDKAFTVISEVVCLRVHCGQQNRPADQTFTVISQTVSEGTGKVSVNPPGKYPLSIKALLGMKRKVGGFLRNRQYRQRLLITVNATDYSEQFRLR